MFNRTSVTSRRAILGLVSVGVVVVVAVAGFAGGYFASSPKAAIPDYNVDADNVAIQGYDTVAYFVDGKATKGKSEFEHSWHDARWQFASTTNRDLFAANPDRYAPQYGGYCSLGLAAGEYANGNPEAWSIVDGKLYLKKAKTMDEAKAKVARWRAAQDYHLMLSDYNWEKNRDQLRDNR